MSEISHLPQDRDRERDVPIGIIGGYGISDDIEVNERIQIPTPYGEPSHPIIVGEFANREVAFLSRHGRGRNIPSHSINYRANLFALHRLGVRRIVSATANGSLRGRIEPGDIAIPSDYIDQTKNRKDTFFDDYPPRLFSSFRPFCPDVGALLDTAAKEVGFQCHSNDVTVVIIAGPRFATLAESEMYRTAGADIIGGSTYPEMALARELEMCYANFALVTDYDNAEFIDGVESEPVTLDAIDEALGKYGDDCTRLIKRTVASIDEERCPNCSGHAELAKSDDHPVWEHRR